MLDGCRYYMQSTLHGSTAHWAYFIFTLAYQLGMRDLYEEALQVLATGACSEDSYIRPLSAALLTRGGPLADHLAVLRSAISSLLRGAIASDALLVVLIMRLDQLAGGSNCPTSPAFQDAAAPTPPSKRRKIMPADTVSDGQTFDGVVPVGEATNSSSTSSTFLPEAMTAALLDLVRWDTLHQAEIKALTSQAATYPRSTAAAKRLRQHFLPQQALAWLGKSSDSLPKGQPSAKHLACWLDTSPGCQPTAAPEGDLLVWHLSGYNRVLSNTIQVKMEATSFGGQGEGYA